MKKEMTLKALFKKVAVKIILNSVLLSIVAIVPILTIAFLNAERNKLELLTQELAAVIKPKIQIGDEIEIRGDLSKSLETTDAIWLSVTAKQSQAMVASKLPSGSESFEFHKTGFLDAFFSPYVTQVSSFRIYPNSSEEFSIRVVFPNTIRLRILGYTLLTALAIALALLAALVLRLDVLLKGVVSPLENLKRYIDTFDKPDSGAGEIENVNRLIETKLVKEKFDSLQNRLEEQRLSLLKKSVEEERGRMAAQLGHDLKSYTSILLNMVDALRSKVGEDDLLILQKSASDISIKMQQLERAGSQNLNEGEKSFVLQLAPCVAQMVEMKVIEFLHDSRLKIRFDFSASALDVFSRIDPVEFRTVISNLINNAVEAIEKNGEVVLSVKRSGERAVVEIRDTGRGIPKEQIGRVGQYGFSTKEGSDRGTGLAKAIEIINRDGGDVAIESTEGVGTLIKLRLLAEWPRNSFIKEVDLSHFERAIIVDNDEAFVGRLKKLITLQSPQLQVATHYNFASFKAWAESSEILSSDMVFMDYDLQELGANSTGIDLIERFNLQDRAILLTHNDSDSKLLDDCDKKNIRLMSKILIEKIKFLTALTNQELIEKYDGSVIDDNLVHIINLKKVAKSKGLVLRFYRRASEFLRDARRLDPKKPILIDSRLERGERGEVLAKQFYDELGFHDIVLNTASAPEDFRDQYPQGMYWIKGIVSKRERAGKIIECFIT